jgi:hypothetical protein
MSKNTDKQNCDCLIGFISGEEVYKSSLEYEVERIENIQPVFKSYGLLNGEPLNKKQIVDGRKGYLRRFNYCPNCGEKLNWKKILENF